jgi:hypothetical protein
MDHTTTSQASLIRQAEALFTSRTREPADQTDGRISNSKLLLFAQEFLPGSGLVVDPAMYPYAPVPNHTEPKRSVTRAGL